MRVEVLGDGQIDAAFPLITAIVPVDLKRWRRFVRSRQTDEGGLLALTVEGSDPVGVLSWFAQSDLQHGSSLVVDNLIVFELRHDAPGAWALVEAAEALARRLHCGKIEVRSRARAGSGAWQLRGWSLNHPRFSKTLVPPADAGAEH